MSNAIQKIAYKFTCIYCDYNTNKKYDYNKHLFTSKHKERENAIQISQSNKIICRCNKTFKHYSSLYRHKKKCIKIEEIVNPNTKNNEIINNDETSFNNESIVEYIKQNNEIKDLLLKENEELKSQLKQQNKQIMELIPKVGNNNTINNNNNQKFNINVFLNEHCKDAMSINEFVKSIQVSLKNLLTTKTKGLGIGINDIINENMNKLSIYERPIHCTDKKRETLYVKHDKWEKDIDKKETTKMLKGLQLQQIKSLHLWKEAHPNYMEDDDLKHEYMILVNKCTKPLSESEKKLFKNLCDNTYVKDEELLIK